MKRTTASHGDGQLPSRRGFTLIEVLVVVAIIALLISILLPSLSAARRSAKDVVCKSNLRQIGVASGAYANVSKRNTFPDWWTAGVAPFRVLPGIKDPDDTTSTPRTASYGLPDVFSKFKIMPAHNKVWICPVNEREARFQQTYFWSNSDASTQDPRSYNPVGPQNYKTSVTGTASANTHSWWVADDYNLKPCRPVDSLPVDAYSAETAQTWRNDPYIYDHWYPSDPNTFAVGWRFWHKGVTSLWHGSKAHTESGSYSGYGINMILFDLSLGFQAMSDKAVQKSVG